MEALIKDVMQKEGAKKDDFFVISVNGKDWQVCKLWFHDGGRAHGSALAHMIMGTREGLQGSMNILLTPKQERVFPMVLGWLAMGDLLLSQSCDFLYRASRDLFALAEYFGLSALQDWIRRNGFSIKSPIEVLSQQNTGFVLRYISDKGFGFILDKDTREQIWFSAHKIVRSDNAQQEFHAGQECVYDIEISRKGRRPNTKHAANIRTSSGEPFRKPHIFETF